MSAQLVGSALILLSTLVYTYYSFWVYVTPFLDEDNTLNGYFLERKWATIIPSGLILVLALIMGSGVTYFWYAAGKKKATVPIENKNK